MREQLVRAGLWDASNPNNPALSVTAAWQLLARAGVAWRYRGQTSGGDYEYLVYDPETGTQLATGKGKTAARAICSAALAAQSQQV